MRVQLKGVHRVKVRLASGALATYYYAWRGGPRLVGEPGSPQFLASYTTAACLILGYPLALAIKAAPDFAEPGTVEDVLAAETWARAHAQEIIAGSVEGA